MMEKERKNIEGERRNSENTLRARRFKRLLEKLRGIHPVICRTGGAPFYTRRVETE